MPLPQLKSDYATAVTFYDPLNPNDVECNHIEPGTVFFDWIRETYPDGFKRPIRLLVNGDEIELTEMDFVAQAGDVISIIVMPAGEAFAIALISALISSVATIAASLIVNLIFGKPKKPKDTPNPDPVYSLEGGRNMIRLGEPVPVNYGRIVTYPDTAAIPYTYYLNNDMYYDAVLCLGQGYHQVHDVLIGDTPSSALAPGVLGYAVFPPDQHLQIMGRIEGATGVRENMITSIEVSNHELTGEPAGGGGGATYVEHQINMLNQTQWQFISTKPLSMYVDQTVWFPVAGSPNYNQYRIVTSYDYTSGIVNVRKQTPQADLIVASNQTLGFYDTATGNAPTSVSGPFIMGKPGQFGNLLDFDFVFPQGLYEMNDEGEFIGTTVDIQLVAEEIDQNNNFTGLVYSQLFSMGRATNTPQRVTVPMNVPLSRYRVKVIRNTPAPPNNKTQNMFVWTGLKFKLINVGTPVYGETTMIAVRLKASNGISPDAVDKIRVVATRMLPRFGSGLYPTRSPADAFADIATNTVYGLGRPVSSIDVTRLQQLEAHWGSYALFDAIFNQRTTIWDALTVCLQPVAAVPVMTGKLLSLVSDGRKIAPTQLFSDANIVDGSFQATYTFDRPGEYAGIQVEYRDPVTFLPAYAQYPAGALDLENVVLFGCTDATVASQYALLLWQRRMRLRQLCSFETEMEGFIPLVGSRILVSTNAVAWGEAGEVVSAPSATSLVLDRTVNFGNYTSPFIVLRNSDGVPTAKIPVSPGANVRTVNLGSAIPIAIHPVLGDRRATSWAVGDTQRKVKDFTIQHIEHIGENTTKVEAVIYDERVWDNTLPFLSIPI